ncbi:hypothetical protein [Aquisalimonas sp.]|uniref:hypothetical protein n=1 Tax=Aquisalimonas sp. TaxID=1872621 RepID=UPI0025BA3549|nr:hypothetical protein [Aquisalimonas sp.]
MKAITASGNITHVAHWASGICLRRLDARDFDTLHTIVLEALHPGTDITPEILAGHVPDLMDWSLGIGELEDGSR